MSDSSDLNDGDVLNLGACFKEIVQGKNEEIKELKKILMMAYAIFRILDLEHEGCGMIERGRGLFSGYLDEFFFQDD